MVYADWLRTWQKISAGIKILPELVEIEEDVTDKIKAIAEIGFDPALECFFTSMGFFWASCSPVRKL